MTKIVSMNILNVLQTWGSLVKFSHSIFALPFAASMVLVVQRSTTVTIAQCGWLLLCVVSARTAAMAFNRLVDRDIDEQNPRTINREIPQGKVSLLAVRLLVLFTSVVFVIGASMLGSRCLVLSPAVLLLLFTYSYSKRFTKLSHIILGLCLSLAPGGVWIALTNQWSWIPVPLMVAVTFWVAGFDILYSCQDFEFDRLSGLFSIPSRWGIKRALLLSRLMHFLSILALLVFGWMASLGGIYLFGVVLFAYLLWSQHSLVSYEGLERIDAIFFSRNGLASVVFFLFVAVDCLFLKVK